MGVSVQCACEWAWEIKCFNHRGKRSENGTHNARTIIAWIVKSNFMWSRPCAIHLVNQNFSILSLSIWYIHDTQPPTPPNTFKRPTRKKWNHERNLMRKLNGWLVGLEQRTVRKRDREKELKTKYARSRVKTLLSHWTSDWSAIRDSFHFYLKKFPSFSLLFFANRSDGSAGQFFISNFVHNFIRWISQIHPISKVKWRNIPSIPFSPLVLIYSFLKWLFSTFPFLHSRTQINYMYTHVYICFTW